MRLWKFTDRHPLALCAPRRDTASVGAARLAPLNFQVLAEKADVR